MAETDQQNVNEEVCCHDKDPREVVQVNGDVLKEGEEEVKPEGWYCICNEHIVSWIVYGMDHSD